MESVLLDLLKESGAAGIVGLIFFLIFRTMIAKHERDIKDCKDHFTKQEEKWNDRLDDCVDDKVNYLKQLNERERHG